MNHNLKITDVVIELNEEGAKSLATGNVIYNIGLINLRFNLLNGSDGPWVAAPYFGSKYNKHWRLSTEMHDDLTEHVVEVYKSKKSQFGKDIRKKRKKNSFNTQHP